MKRDSINFVSFKRGLSFFLEKGKFFLNGNIGKDRWGFEIFIQVHQHFLNFDKCFTLHFGLWDEEFIKVIDIW